MTLNLIVAAVGIIAICNGHPILGFLIMLTFWSF